MFTVNYGKYGYHIYNISQHMEISLCKPHNNTSSNYTLLKNIQLGQWGDPVGKSSFYLAWSSKISSTFWFQMVKGELWPHKLSSDFHTCSLAFPSK